MRLPEVPSRASFGMCPMRSKAPAPNARRPAHTSEGTADLGPSCGFTVRPSLSARMGIIGRSIVGLPKDKFAPQLPEDIQPIAKLRLHPADLLQEVFGEQPSLMDERSGEPECADERAGCAQ